MSDMSKSHLDSWLSKAEAAAFLGCAEKTLDRMAARKQVQKNIRYRRGAPPLIVFHPEDLARIKEQREQPPEPFVVPENGVVRSSHSQQLAPALVEFLTALRRSHEPYDLFTLKRAHEASGLPKKYLHEHFVKGRRGAVMIGRRWYIPHAKLATHCRHLSDMSEVGQIGHPVQHARQGDISTQGL